MSFTNQMLGALGTATGALAAGEHIADQKQQREQKALSSSAQLETAIGELNLKKAQQAEAEQVLAEAEQKESSDDIVAAIAGNSGLIDKLNNKEQEYFTQMAKGNSRDDKTGRFISQEEANIRYADLMDELYAAKKAKKSMENKWEVRKNMIADVNAKKNEVKLAQVVKDQAQLIFDKQKKYLPKGGNK